MSEGTPFLGSRLFCSVIHVFWLTISVILVFLVFLLNRTLLQPLTRSAIATEEKCSSSWAIFDNAKKKRDIAPSVSKIQIVVMLQDSYYMNLGWDLMFELSYDERGWRRYRRWEWGQCAPKSWVLYHHLLGTAQAEESYGGRILRLLIRPCC